MSDEPNEVVGGKASPQDSGEPPRPYLPRWARYAIIPGVLGPVLILVFIFRAELAHDEGRCPFQQVSKRSIGEATWVREDRRRCLPEVEERRFTLVRDDVERVLGRRRLAPEDFEPGRYEWEASVLDDGQVQVIARSRGHEDAHFREGTAAERGESP